jgi:hypothetical protein
MRDPDNLGVCPHCGRPQNLFSHIMRKGGPGFPLKTMRSSKEESIGWIPNVQVHFWVQCFSAQVRGRVEEQAPAANVAATDREGELSWEAPQSG